MSHLLSYSQIPDGNYDDGDWYVTGNIWLKEVCDRQERRRKRPDNAADYFYIRSSPADSVAHCPWLVPHRVKTASIDYVHIERAYTPSIDVLAAANSSGSLPDDSVLKHIYLKAFRWTDELGIEQTTTRNKIIQAALCINIGYNRAMNIAEDIGKIFCLWAKEYFSMYLTFLHMYEETATLADGPDMVFPPYEGDVFPAKPVWSLPAVNGQCKIVCKGSDYGRHASWSINTHLFRMARVVKHGRAPVGPDFMVIILKARDVYDHYSPTPHRYTTALLSDTFCFHDEVPTNLNNPTATTYRGSTETVPPSYCA